LALDKERVAFHLRTAENWSDLQARLQPLGLEVDRRGQNLVLTNGGKAELKLADVARDTTARQLELRLGAFDAWRGQAVEFQERLREATATQLQIRHLDTTWQRTTGLAARLEDRLQAVHQNQLQRARLEGRVDDLLGRIVVPRDLEAAKTNLADYRRAFGDARTVAWLERNPEDLGRFRGLQGPAGLQTRQRTQAWGNLIALRNVLTELDKNQLVGQALEGPARSAPTRLDKLIARATDLAHERFRLVTEKEAGTARLGELAKRLGENHLGPLVERALKGLPEHAPSKGPLAATVAKAATPAVLTKANIAWSVVKGAIDHVERAAGRER
jgi:hypothetical protein